MSVNYLQKQIGGDNISFEITRDSLYRHFEENMANKMLFRVDCDTEDLWNLYMDSLPKEINPIYRERKVHDCSTCHSFFRHAANMVAVDEDTYELTTLFDCVPHKDYEGVFEALSEFIKEHEIADVFKVDMKTVGHKFDREQL